MNIKVTRAHPTDAPLLVLRAADRQEVEMWVPERDISNVVEASILNSVDTFTGWDGEQVVAIGGWSWAGPDRISPWLLGSDLVALHKKELMRWSHAFIQQLRKAHPDKMLCNHVAKSNRKAQVFLKALGFTIVPTPGLGEFDFFYILPCVNQQP